MNNFFDKTDFSFDDIRSLINNEVEESIHLDFKDAAALDKSDRKKDEISKDISAFANSDGGII
ncbi:AlbA family DNA-binding domain-containing protein [Parachryseolinea silvisoli]|uniref:AlbA family DNA-binding domain-containing protein n=1 Tax=Parachryseolinea silvisoli TaxID=2873601 RepID=UPI002265E083|nr:ATP-binding protein [Parachryseolinea silvisoli]MCD9015178.1 ATP-binding protein [Parachryseolinea silvisoli]